jgi:hypothetical protein
MAKKVKEKGGDGVAAPKPTFNSRRNNRFVFMCSLYKNKANVFVFCFTFSWSNLSKVVNFNRLVLR